MAEYKITVTLDAGQDKVLRNVATQQDASPEDLLQTLAASITSQIDQIISDRIANKIKKLSPADVLARIEYFDGE